MKSSKLFITLSIGLLVTASLIIGIYIIESSDRDQETKTVKWFEEHPKEREEMLTKCKEDPIELGDNPNCINARQAIKNNSFGTLPDFVTKPPVKK